MTRGPDFIIPGASKSGTTTLFHFLSSHQNIFIPESKELHFFDRNTNYNQGISEYERQFSPADDEHVAGEITPSYFYANIIYEYRSHDGYRWNPVEDVPARIYEHYPNLKIILTLRNPITRAHSQFQKNYRQGRERSNSFTEALQAELTGKRQPESHPSCWLYRNMYTDHIGRWFDLFDRDQILVIIFEEWVEDTVASLNEICDFLEIAPRQSWPQPDTKKNTGGQPRMVALNRFYQDHIRDTLLGQKLREAGVTHVFDTINSSDGYPELSGEARHLLSGKFEPMVDELEAILDHDLDVWREEFEGNV